MRTVEEIGAVIGQPPAPVMLKQISALDAGCRAVLARSPIAAFGYRDGDGTSVTTFVGGRPGFARSPSPGRVTLPVPPGVHGPVSLFFLLPGVGEVLRVNGTATGRDTVNVDEAYVHCAQAVLRSRLWQPPGPAATVPAVAGDGPLSGPGVAAFLAAAPFLALSTWDDRGGSDTSPRGDQGAVARILDDRTLLIADRKGNKRADTLHNLMYDDRLSLAALVPGRAGVLHLHGRGTVTTDPELLAPLALRGTPPHAALLVDVAHAEIRDSDTIAGARLWSPDAHVVPGSVPDLMVLAGEHLAANSGRTGRLLRMLWAIPGIERALRWVMARAYRSGLRAEGYADGALREVRIAGIRRETPSAVTLVLSDPAGGTFDFRPGQFFTLVTDVDGTPVRRAYSASSAPGPALEVTVKLLTGGVFSTHVHRRLRTGDRLGLLGPSGTFHAPPGAELVLVAAGSGVTPMMSMIRSSSSRIALLLSNRSEADVIFAAELARLAAARPERLSVTHVLTSRDGRLDEDGIRDWIAGVAPGVDAHYHVCGPVPLMDTVRSVLAGNGIDAGRVHSERYAAGAVALSTEPQELTVAEDGQPVGTATVAPGQTLLDAGLAAGLPMPYSCMAGGCGECAIRLVAGSVTRVESDGSVLACVSCPLSPVTLDIGRP
ncbi:MAG TPA: 2Fe-2S iron-sulfur cluster-binding protein [Actinoplanes sp.]|nr:2Fe-2S iron-sulfur cluster-binding protein [Actinoplanes sp.]